MATPRSKKLPVGKGKLGYTTSNVFRAPLKKVWEAATQGKHLKKHFIDDFLGEFGPALEPVTWTWKEYGSWTFIPIKFVREKEIIFLAPGPDEKYLLTIRFEFVRKGNKTIFRVHDSGYATKHLRNAFMMCEGWSEFHTALKAYVGYGKDLRKI